MSVRRYPGRGCVFKSKGAKRQNRLRKKSRTEERWGGRGGHLAGYHRLALLYRSEVPSDVKVAPTAERPVLGSGGRARDRRTGERQTTMHDATTPASEIGEQLTAQLTAFNRVLLRGVKSKSPHGIGICSDLTDLTDSLIGKDIQGRVRARARAPVSSASLASERIGKIGKIGTRRRALMRFSVNRQQSNGVESRLMSSKIGGWSA
jgi:hypothetical protein